MDREEHQATRRQQAGLLLAVEAARSGILGELDVLGELAIAAQREREPLGYDLECSVERIRRLLSSLETELAALVDVESASPPRETQRDPVLVG